MKALFAVPPTRDESRPTFVVPPLGLLYLAGAAISGGHQAQLLDAQAEGLSWDEFERRVTNSDADIVALSGMTPVWDITRRAAGIIKKAGKTVIVGGPHVTMLGPDFFEREKDFDADMAVIGEGEKAFVRLLDALSKGESPASIPGVVVRSGHCPPGPVIQNIDELPLPARQLLNHRLYSYPLLGSGPASTIFTSRGCPYSCVFCDKNVFGSKVRLHSPERVIEELNEIVCGTGVNSVIIYDDLFTISRERVVEICRRIIESGLRFVWKCEGRVDGVDPELLGWMSRAGCRIVAYGVETAHEAGLRFLKKGVTAQDAARAAMMTRSAGMEALGYFLVGIPGETIEDVKQTARFAARWRFSWAQFSVLSPIEGTTLWDISRREGWYAQVDALNPFDADINRPALLEGYWTPEKLRKALNVAYREFYLRPSYAWTRLRRAGGAQGAAELTRRGLELVGWMLKTIK